MIITGAIQIVFNIIYTIFALIPPVPAMPTDITSAIDSILSIIAQGAGFMSVILGSALLHALLVAALAIINFERLYRGTMWILRKIPLLNIK